jgi:hypothetical protein
MVELLLCAKAELAASRARVETPARIVVFMVFCSRLDVRRSASFFE